MYTYIGESRPFTFSIAADKATETTTITCHMLELPHAKKMLQTYTLIPICTYMKAALPFAVASHIFVLCFFGVKNLWFKDTKIKFN